MITTTDFGMHVRAIVDLDEAAGTCICFGYGSPERRQIPHPKRIEQLKADGGVDEIRAKAKESHGQEENRRHDTDEAAGNAGR